MKNRIKIYLLNRRLLRERGIIARYGCTHKGCTARISTLRFLLLGCECRMHRWLRRWGGLVS